MEKAKDHITKIHTLLCWKQESHPAHNYHLPAKLAAGRQLRSVLPINPNNFEIKASDKNEFKDRIEERKEKNKTSIMINTHGKWSS